MKGLYHARYLANIIFMYEEQDNILQNNFSLYVSKFARIINDFLIIYDNQHFIAINKEFIY